MTQRMMLAAAAALFLAGCASNSFEDKVHDMTLEEKVHFLVGTCTDSANPPQAAPGTSLNRPRYENHGANTYFAKGQVAGAAGESYSIERLGIPSIVYADGPAGLRIDKVCTAFPTAALLASTWDIDAVQSIGSAMGNEVRENGVDILLAPGMNTIRNPLTGRNFEYYSEDPILSGKVAAAMVRGVQSQGVGACIKHFAVNNQELFRNGVNAIVSERALREIYLKGFEIAVKEGHPWTVMSSYNKVNDEYASESPKLLTNILRNEWGFDGFVMTDWWAADDPVQQMIAGNDLLMPGTPLQYEEIISAVRSGRLDESIIDRNVRNILRIMGRTPKAKGYRYSGTPDLDAHAALAREIAPQGMVLLENRGEALPATNAADIALFGVYSYDTQSGGSGSGYVNRAYKITLADGLESAGNRVDSTISEAYISYINEVKAHLPAENFWYVPTAPEMPVRAEVIAEAARCDDYAIITLGRMSGEGADRHSGEEDYLLGKTELKLVEDVCEAFHAVNKKVIVVLNTGSTIELYGWNDLPDAILQAWLPGQEAGHAIADVITGKSYPSGKLPVTLAEHYWDIPSSKNFGLSTGYHSGVKYEEELMVGYRFFNTSASVKQMYPFGFGLSYTEFSYSSFNLEEEMKDGSITVSLEITNCGERPGREIAQIYVEKPNPGKDRPSCELCSFAKTSELQPGESERLYFTISKDLLRKWTDTGWTLEPGKYVLNAAAASDDFRRSLTYTVK